MTYSFEVTGPASLECNTSGGGIEDYSIIASMRVRYGKNQEDESRLRRLRIPIGKKEYENLRGQLQKSKELSLEGRVELKVKVMTSAEDQNP